MYLKIPIRGSLFYVKRGIGIKLRRQIVQGLVAPKKNWEGEGSSRGIIQKCGPRGRSPCAPRFDEMSKVETLLQERCARGAAWNLAKNIDKLKHADKAS